MEKETKVQTMEIEDSRDSWVEVYKDEGRRREKLRERCGEMERDRERWREMDRDGDRWREMERDGE